MAEHRQSGISSRIADFRLNRNDNTMSGQVRRTREGCWTCRKRKKKCRAERPVCQNCRSLKLHCEGYAQKILWEDDRPRIGMRRRGPAKRGSQNKRHDENISEHWTFRETTSKAADEAPHEKVNHSERRPPPVDITPTDDENIVSIALSKQHGRARPEVCVDDLLPSSPLRFLSPHPLRLTPLQSLFLDHYLNNFSLKYPTYLDPSNPFLSTLVPLALRNTTVLCAVLAIGGIQTGLQGRLDVDAEILALKGRTLRGCRKLLQCSGGSKISNSDLFSKRPLGGEALDFASSFVHENTGNGVEQDIAEDDLMLFASVMMLMVHDKLSGEPCSHLRPHLQFAHHFERRNRVRTVSVHFKFLRNIFLYNDLLASIASGSPTLRDYGQDTVPSASDNSNIPNVSVGGVNSSMLKLGRNRYYLPILLSRIANGIEEVTLADIERWDGNMTWLPSFSSSDVAEATAMEDYSPQHQSSIPIADEAENQLISEIYRNAARVFYYQRRRYCSKEIDKQATSWTSNYDFEIQHFNSILLTDLRSLPLGSAYESSLLFPIGIAAMEIHSVDEKAYVLSRLQLLENRFQLNHFRRFREKLSAFWDGNETRFFGQQFACDAILLG